MGTGSPSRALEGLPPSRSQPRTVAVIDIGTASVRMAIAEIDARGEIVPLDALHRPVSIGKDTFTSGRINTTTIEECVAVLKSFRRVLQEYGIDDATNIRAVATSAVREASNRDQFLDRIYSATGIEVDAIDEAEVSRLTYLMALPAIHGIPKLWNRPTLVVEIGGGSTEILLLKQGGVEFSGTYRLGALRMREMLDRYQAPIHSLKSVMMTHIQRTLDQIQLSLGQTQSLNLLFIGGDARFAANHLYPDWNGHDPIQLHVAALSELSDDVLSLSEDELVQRFHVTYSDADSLGPALLSMVMLASTLELKKVTVTNLTLRDGLLEEMASESSWTPDFREQMVQSALELGRRFHFDVSHATHVAKMSRKLFAQLQQEHGLEDRYDHLLYLAALLHEIGLVIATRSHHKHSMYLILHSELFGLGKRDQLLVALIARYHRRAAPRIDHEGYARLNREQRIIVCKLAAILRLADALDRGHGERIRDVSCRINGSRLRVSVTGVEDVTLERLAAQEKGTLFEEIFGLQVELVVQGGDVVK